jgi:hypothetical protein
VEDVTRQRMAQPDAVTVTSPAEAPKAAEAPVRGLAQMEPAMAAVMPASTSAAEALGTEALRPTAPGSGHDTKSTAAAGEPAVHSEGT